MSKPFQDIFTPRSIVEELMGYCDIKDGDSIFDPCGGSGNLIIPILEKYDVNVTAVEIQQKHIDMFIKRVSEMEDIEIIEDIDEIILGDTYDDFF